MATVRWICSPCLGSTLEELDTRRNQGEGTMAMGTKGECIFFSIQGEEMKCYTREENRKHLQLDESQFSE